MPVTASDGRKVQSAQKIPKNSSSPLFGLLSTNPSSFSSEYIPKSADLGSKLRPSKIENTSFRRVSCPDLRVCDITAPRQPLLEASKPKPFWRAPFVESPQSSSPPVSFLFFCFLLLLMPLGFFCRFFPFFGEKAESLEVGFWSVFVEREGSSVFLWLR